MGIIKRADKGPILLLFVATNSSFLFFFAGRCVRLTTVIAFFTGLFHCTLISLFHFSVGLAQVTSGQPFFRFFFLEDLSGRSKALERLRHTAVNADDMNNGLNFFFAHTVINRAAAMHFPFVHLS